jgi:hypothetical protein
MPVRSKAFIVGLFFLPHVLLALLTSSDPCLLQRRFCTALWTAPKDEAQRLLGQAEKLRQEIASFQQEKRAVEEAKLLRQEDERRIRQELTQQYSAVVPILKPDGSAADERVTFRPTWTEGSFILVRQAFLPLGIILGESEDFPETTVVDAVADGSNGQQADIQLGDIVRACTACKMEMEMPAWQLMAGGIGIPKTKRFMYSVDGRPFEEVLDAVASNRLDPQGRAVLLVLERRGEPSQQVGMVA